MIIFRQQSHAEAKAQEIANDCGCRVGVFCRRILGGRDWIAHPTYKGAPNHFPGGRECWIYMGTTIPNRWDR